MNLSETPFSLPAFSRRQSTKPRQAEVHLRQLDAEKASG
jgi:hypothetical protein